MPCFINILAEINVFLSVGRAISCSNRVTGMMPYLLVADVYLGRMLYLEEKLVAEEWTIFL